jgi:hypothetical protein
MGVLYTFQVKEKVVGSWLSNYFLGENKFYPRAMPFTLSINRSFFQYFQMNSL